MAASLLCAATSLLPRIAAFVRKFAWRRLRREVSEKFAAKMLSPKTVSSDVFSLRKSFDLWGLLGFNLGVFSVVKTWPF